MNVNNAGDSTKVLPFVEYKEYKDVQRVQKDEEDDKQTAVTVVEKTLRTDIKPIKIKEDIQFEIIPMQIIIGTLPIILAGVIVIPLILIKGKRRKNGADKNE